MTNQQKQYQTIGLGGTFDHFHAGHEKFLMFASDLSNLLIIGITNQNIARKKTYPNSIERFAERVHAVENFCRTHKILHEIIELSNSVGTTTTDNRIEALAVTTETKIGGKQINQLRKERGLTPLPLHVCELLSATDAKPLHSDRIRAGECDRAGLVYAELFTQTITIKKNQRISLSHPRGPMVDRPSFLSNNRTNSSTIILVGDSTIERFTSNNWPFHIGIFDRKIERKPAEGVTLDIRPDLVVQNPAGTITKELAQSIQSSIQSGFTKPNYIFVEGEEDLAAIPAVMLAPLGSVVYYGQPRIGLIEIIITEETKQQLATILR